MAPHVQEPDEYIEDLEPVEVAEGSDPTPDP